MVIICLLLFFFWRARSQELPFFDSKNIWLQKKFDSKKIDFKSIWHQRKLTPKILTPKKMTPKKLPPKIERRNSKGRSGYTFWLILQKTFAVFSHQKLKVAQIWSTHQSKALIFYFGIKKIVSWIFENFVENRQTKFHILKFRVCKHTLNLNSWNVLCLFPTKFSKLKLKIFFYVKIENQSFRLMGGSYLYHF